MVLFDFNSTFHCRKDKIKILKKYMNEWRHSIRDCTDNMDQRPFAVKDLMTQLCTLWNDLLPVDTVV